jgi:hypothetical protein
MSMQSPPLKETRRLSGWGVYEFVAEGGGGWLEALQFFLLQFYSAAARTPQRDPHSFKSSK